jgi:hypothetical protein
VDRPDNRDSVDWVAHQIVVRRPWLDAVKAVGRQLGNLVLEAHPSLGVPDRCGQDDQRFRIESAKCSGLGLGAVGGAELIEEPAHLLPGRSGGTCIVPCFKML